MRILYLYNSSLLLERVGDVPRDSIVRRGGEKTSTLRLLSLPVVHWATWIERRDLVLSFAEKRETRCPNYS